MTRWKWLPIAGGVVAGAAAVLLGRGRETSVAERLEAALLEDAARPGDERVDFGVFAELPPPVARYLRYVLTDGQPLIWTAAFRQTGELRTGLQTESWLPFTARHLVVPPATGFVWNARVDTLLATHIRVLDSYVAGAGGARVSLLSVLPVATVAGVPEMNAGALHRYLAEAVWYPTALLPGAGVVWSPIDDASATATLAHAGTTVSLEFRFNDAGEATGIFTPARFGSFDGEYRQVAWEGHFRDYEERAGMRVPAYGEVGWYEEGTLGLVWKGQIIEARYEVGP